MSRTKARGATRQQIDQFQILLQAQEDDVWPKLGTGHRHATYQRILLEGVTRAEYLSAILPEKDQLSYLVQNVVCTCKMYWGG